MIDKKTGPNYNVSVVVCNYLANNQREGPNGGKLQKAMAFDVG